MRPGEVVDGRFELLREAGVGGMGVVYEARDKTNGVRVAVKVLVEEKRDAVRRFLRESELLARLDHPAIVRYVTHASRSEGSSAGPPYLVMEWLDGEELTERLARGRLEVDDAVRLATRIADAVGEAHARGLVHRDLKPGNVFLEGGTVDGAKLLDFGLAREIFVDRHLTADGLVLGTVGYLSPEQARNAGAVDARTDVFALGCILYECLTGRPAFTGGHAVAILAKLLVEPAPRVRDLRPDVPRALDALVARMLEKDPNLRPSDGRAVVAALADRPSTTGTSLRPPALGEVEQRVLAVILVGDPRSPKGSSPDSSGAHPSSANDDATVIALHTPDAPAAVARAVAPFDAAIDIAVDGTVVATLRATGSGRDRAVAAARCALALRAACPGAPIALSLGRGQTRGGTAGEVIERAAALLATARAEPTKQDAVHADDAIASLLDARFVMTPTSTGVLLHAERNVHESTRLLLGHVTPFVGRGRELGNIVQSFTDTVLDGSAGAFVVVGEAGSGKSRLREEVVRAVRRREPDARVWIGGADPLRTETAFGLAEVVLRDAMDIHADLDRDEQRRLLGERVAEQLEPSDAERVTHFLAEIVGCRFDDDYVLLVGARRSSAVMRDQTFRAWLDWVGSVRVPLLVVLDDLQWADAVSIQLLDATLRAMHDRPFMVLALARPEVAEAFPRLWAERGTQTLRLAPLAERAATQLAREALASAGVTDDALAALLVRRAQGNPFVLEELVRSRATAGAIGALPEGVLALVQTRLDAEDPIARRVLRAASIFGREAPPAGIAHLLGEGFDETSVRETLRGLAEREVLEASGPEGADFVFRHDLVREAAYATLTDGDRSLGHGLAGDWLESNGARDAAVMAAHFDRGGDRARAARWYARAAVQLLEGNDLATAEKHATRSLELAVDTDESVRGHALLVLAQVRRWIGDTASVVELAFDAADRLAPGTLDWFSALQAATSVADTTGRRDVAERVLDRVLAAQPTNAAAAGARVVTMATVASSRLHDGDDVGAKELMERVAAESVELAERDPIVLAYVHRASATRAGNQGDFAAELAGWRAAAEAFGRGGERRLVVVARCNEGYGWLALGAYEQAERTLRDALAEAESMDLQHVAAAARHNLGLALAHLGKVEEGLREETNAIDVLVRTGDHRLASNALSYRATIRALAGDLEGAEDDARKAVVDTAFTTRGLALAVLSDVLLARGKVDEALSIAAEGMDISKSGTLEGGTSAVRLAWANALFAVGRVEEAHAAIDDAIRDLYERAARIEDEAMRGQFLRDEVTHAKILKRADEWDVTTRT